jgi:hypothetical protein
VLQGFTSDDKIRNFLSSVDASVCQACIERGSGMPFGVVTADLVALAAKGELGARRGHCGACRAWTAVFHAKTRFPLQIEPSPRAMPPLCSSPARHSVDHGAIAGR